MIPSPRPIFPVQNISAVDSLKHAFAQWKRLVKDREMLRVVGEGYGFEFETPPILSATPIPFDPPVDPERYEILDQGILSMIDKGVFHEVIDNSPGFYSRFFHGAKENGGVSDR